MLKINFMSTLFVGIDVGSKSNVDYAMDFYKNKYISSSFSNNQPGAEELAGIILECLKKHPNLTNCRGRFGIHFRLQHPYRQLPVYL